MASAEGRTRINILDIIIIIVLIALIAGLFFRDNIVSMLSKDDMSEITYTFEIKELDRTRLSYLVQNVGLTDKNSGRDMGKIKLVNSVNAYVTEYDVDGSAVKIKKDGYYDAAVTATAKGFKSDSGTFIGGELSIIPGQTFTVNTETSVYNVTILSVN